jgi:hypothetical protein
MNDLIGPVATCPCCERELSDDERRAPLRDADGLVLCDDCWSEQYEAQCHHCGRTVIDEEDIDGQPAQLTGRPGELIVLYEPCPTDDAGDLPPGIYRVLAWPIYTAPMIGSGWLEARHLRRVADIDMAVALPWEHHHSTALAGPMCWACRWHYDRPTT